MCKQNVATKKNSRKSWRPVHSLLRLPLHLRTLGGLHTHKSTIVVSTPIKTVAISLLFKSVINKGHMFNRSLWQAVTFPKRILIVAYKQK